MPRYLLSWPWAPGCRSICLDQIVNLIQETQCLKITTKKYLGFKQCVILQHETFTWRIKFDFNFSVVHLFDFSCRVCLFLSCSKHPLKIHYNKELWRSYSYSPNKSSNVQNACQIYDCSNVEELVKSVDFFSITGESFKLEVYFWKNTFYSIFNEKKKC